MCHFNNELIMGFHPETEFSMYEDAKRRPLFSPAKAKLLDGIMKEAFTVCAKENTDICSLSMELVVEFYRIEAQAGRPVPGIIEHLITPEPAGTKVIRGIDLSKSL